jgi:plasmid stability protein
MVSWLSVWVILVQIRDLPEQAHRTLKARAALAGTSLSEYLRAELVRVASRPTPEELAARVRARDPVAPDEPAAASVRRLRDAGQ